MTQPHHPPPPPQPALRGGGELFHRVKTAKNQGVRARITLGGLDLDLKLIILCVNSRESVIKREPLEKDYGSLLGLLLGLLL